MLDPISNKVPSYSGSSAQNEQPVTAEQIRLKLMDTEALLKSLKIVEESDPKGEKNKASLLDKMDSIKSSIDDIEKKIQYAKENPGTLSESDLASLTAQLSKLNSFYYAIVSVIMDMLGIQAISEIDPSIAGDLDAYSPSITSPSKEPKLISSEEIRKAFVLPSLTSIVLNVLMKILEQEQLDTDLQRQIKVTSIGAMWEFCKAAAQAAIDKGDYQAAQMRTQAAVQFALMGVSIASAAASMVNAAVIGRQAKRVDWEHEVDQNGVRTGGLTSKGQADKQLWISSQMQHSPTSIMLNMTKELSQSLAQAIGQQIQAGQKVKEAEQEMLQMIYSSLQQAMQQMFQAAEQRFQVAQQRVDEVIRQMEAASQANVIRN